MSDDAPRDATAPETFEVEASEEGQRLDAFLANRNPDYSRVQLRRAISAGDVTVDGKKAKPSYRLVADQSVTIVFPQRAPTGPVAEPIQLKIVFEDESLAVIDKPAGMVVHPAKGHWSGTLTAALAHHFQQLSQVGGATRPGIVHRLDRDTSGLIIVAKTDEAHMGLAKQFEDRTVAKHYQAIVSPAPDRDRDWIEAPIGPHPYQREKMAIRNDGRPSRTFFEVVKRFRGLALLSVFPKTGRTHQIRVHMTHLGYPIVADRLYSGRNQLTRGDLSGDRDDKTVLLSRQALHAHRLSLKHPLSGTPMEWESPLPEDLQTTLDAIEQFRSS